MPRSGRIKLGHYRTLYYAMSKHWPKSVIRALGEKTRDNYAPYEEEQILDWINAAAPMAASTLINQLRSSDEAISQRAAVHILEWAVGKPKASKLDKDDQRARTLYEIVVPSQAESFEDWIEKLNASRPESGGNGMDCSKEGDMQ